MELKKVYINGKETGLIVEGFDVKNDSIYLKVHRKEDEFPEMMKKIGNPNNKIPKKFENRIKKILENQKEWYLEKISFNCGYVTFQLTTPRTVCVEDIAKVLKLDFDPEHPIIVPLAEEKVVPHHLKNYLHSWVYTINCRNEYFKFINGFPETMRVQHAKVDAPDWL